MLRPVFPTHQVGVSLVSNHLWETVALSRLLGDPPGGREIPPRMDATVRPVDIVPFRHVDRSPIVGQSRECGQRMGCHTLGKLVTKNDKNGAYRTAVFL